jgi:nucleotide-binding universal stress UspA family protein
MQRAIALASRAPSHVLHFVCALEPHGQVLAVPHRGRVDFDYTERVEKVVLEHIAAELHRTSIGEHVHFFVHVRIGRPADEILALASEVGADLIIIGSKGVTGIERLMLGSVSEQVVREAKCTVEVARSKTYPRVELLAISEVEPQRTYVPPHRYTYSSRCVNRRPDEWPLY